VRLKYHFSCDAGAGSDAGAPQRECSRRRASTTSGSEDYTVMSINDQSVCAICGQGSGHRLHRARENMYGTGETFRYLECGDCGCLQLLDPPADMAPYYPDDYCAHGVPRYRRPAAWRRAWKGLRTRALLGRFGPGARRLNRWLGLPPYGPWMEGLPLDLDARILDLGCGNGQLLLRMQKDGFRHLTGVDAFIPADLEFPPGVAIRKGEIDQVTGTFDLIMLHHSLEHLPDQHGAFAAVAAALAPAGRLVIRIPLSGGHAWRKYGVDWANLDAPRHLFLHSLHSFHLLADRAGFVIERVLYDSLYKQVALSELLSLGYSMRDADPLIERYFRSAEVKAMRRFARELNDRRDGDCAAFILAKRDSRS
jgi:SAM-dependent methyltransferase